MRGLQTFPSLLHPRGVLHYFHFTNNLRTIAQDAGSGGAMERASFQNRETDISLSLARDQVYIWASDPWQEEKGEKLLARWDHWKWRCWIVVELLLSSNGELTQQSSQTCVSFGWTLELTLNFIVSDIASDMQDWKKDLSRTILLHNYCIITAICNTQPNKYSIYDYLYLGNTLHLFPLNYIYRCFPPSFQLSSVSST